MSDKTVEQYFKEMDPTKLNQLLIRKTFEEGITNESKSADYIKKAQNYGEFCKKNMQKLGISTYSYYSNFDKTYKMQKDLFEISRDGFNDNTVQNALKETHKISQINVSSTNFSKSAESSKNDSKKMYLDYMRSQKNAILCGINNDALLTISQNDINELNNELLKINSRSGITKFLDFFKGQSKVIKERAVQIERAKKIIEQKIDELKQEKENPSIPTEQFTPEQVIVNLVKARAIFSSDLENKYNTILDFVKSDFEVNYATVNELCKNDKNNLPQVKNNNVKISESEKMNWYLSSKGYLEEKTTLQVEPVDPFKLWNEQKQNSIKIETDQVHKMIKNLEDSSDDIVKANNPNLKGVGKGFNIVR